MSNYNRWIYLLHDIAQYDLIKDNELFYDVLNNALFLRVFNGYDIEITDKEIYDHIVDYNNPHNITKDDLGLSRIPNVLLTSVNQFNDHINDTNPHNVTKKQIELGNVENYEFANSDDIDNRVGDKYLSPYYLKNIIDTTISDKLESDKVVFSVTTNTDNYITSLRRRGSLFWTDGNSQIITKGTYEYKIIAIGYYAKVGTISIQSSKEIHFDLNKADVMPLDRQTLDGSLELAIAIDNNSRVHIWGDDMYNGISKSSLIEDKSIRHVFTHMDLYTVLYDDGTLYHWGNTDKYEFLNDIPSDRKYKHFVMNSLACALIDEDNKLHCYGDSKFTSGTPTSNMSQIYCNSNTFIGITPNGQLIGWGINHNNMISSIPLGSYKHVAITDNDIIAMRDSNTVRKWGKDDLIKQIDVPIDDISLIDINGNSMASLSLNGELKLSGRIKEVVSPDDVGGVYVNLKLINPTTIVLINTNKEIEVYPRSTSLLYTSKPIQKIF